MIRIGLEVHVHPRTKSKLFCSCPADRSPDAMCPICTAQPGAKPMAPNKEAIRKTVMLAEALGCKIEDEITFLRKHYFYPDLPAGFQRTSTPIGTGGRLAGVRIREIHLEEDAGRYDPRKGLVDYSRAGVPLVEIVTEPDMHSKEDARKFLSMLSDVLDFLDFWDDKVMRADVNISVDDGERVEVKEVSTIKGIMKVIELESSRPSRERVTKHFDEIRKETRIAREKETEMDYRFIRDPDIPTIKISPTGQRSYEEILQELKTRIPTQIARTILVSGLYPAYRRMKDNMEPKEIVEWVPIILGELKYRGIDPREFIPSQEFFTIIDKLRKGEITKSQAVSGLRDILDGRPLRLEFKRDLDLTEIVREVLQEEKEAVKKYRRGKKSVLNFLVGKVVAKTKGSISPTKIREKLRERLERE